MLLYEKYVWISQTDQLVYMSNDSNNMYAFVKSVKIKSQYNVAILFTLKNLVCIAHQFFRLSSRVSEC